MTSAQVGTGCTSDAKRVRGRSAAGLGAALLLAGLPAGAAASEPPDEGCPVVASAQGIQIVVTASDNLLLSAPTGAGVPVAQACVDYGVRDSTAFASSPYPGETVIAAPGLLANRLGQEVPGYPAYAASRHPAREQAEAEQPGYQLSARSTETASNAWARSAAGPDDTDAGSALATARSAVDPAAKAATAAATADTQPLTINKLLRLGQVHSVASAKTGPDGTVRRSSDLRIGRTTVGDQEVVITPKGVRAAGQTLPAPDAGPAEALEAAGITVRYLAAEPTRRGVLSAGIEVVARHEDPESGAVTTVQYTLGRSFAAVAPVEDEPGEVPALDPPVGTGSSGGPSGDGGSVDGGAVADGAEPAAAAPAPAGVPQGSDAPPPAVASADRLAAHPIDMGMTGLYLVLVFGALAMFAGGTLLRLLGVKTRWTS